MEKIPWDMVGAIFGGLSFILTLMIEWEKLRGKIVRQVLSAFFVGILIYVIVISIPILFPPGGSRPGTVTKAAPASTTAAPRFIKQISVPSNLASGINYKAPDTGAYTFKYVDSAFTAFDSCWSTRVVAYFGSVPHWDTQNNLDEVDTLFSMGSAECVTTNEAAIKRTHGEIASFELKDGDVITLVAGDGRPDYFDNVGNIVLDIYLLTK